MSNLKNCPKCHAALEGARLSCGECGWSKRKLEAGPADADRSRCAYVADGMRCKYPGVWSESTNGSGSKYCRGHTSGASPMLAAQIVQASQSYVEATPAQRLEDYTRMGQAEALAYTESIGMGQLLFESGEDYAKRLREYCLERMGILAQRMSA